MRRIWWRDSAMTWPSLTVRLHLFPWAWRLLPWGWYDYSPGWNDPMEKDSRAGSWHATGQWLMVEVDFGFNLPPFTLEGPASADTTGGESDG